MIEYKKIVLIFSTVVFAFNFSFLRATPCSPSDNPCSGSTTCTWFYHDADNDGLGESNGAGWYCSGSSVDSNGIRIVTNENDFDDSCACTQSQGNTFAACYDCLGNCISNTPSDYIGDNTGLTNVCTSAAAAGRKGCDVCDKCNGSGFPYYTDSDGDGWGTGTANSCTLTGNANNSSDLDDTCDCIANTTTALAAGGSCKDDSGMCNGINYISNCSNLEFVTTNFPDTGKCPSVGCDGTVNGTGSFQFFSEDVDGDGLGGRYYGWSCSVGAASSSPALVIDHTDFDDSCACTQSQGNTFAACYDCLGNCISNTPSDYLGDNAGLTNVCTSDAAAGRKGCDVCDICNGPGYPYYTDADGDGWGTGTANSCTLRDNADNGSDLDDTCDCFANTTTALAAGGSCRDLCGVCNGNNTPLTGTCDCAGTPNGTAKIDMCNTCDTDISNDCVQDCEGVWGGGAVKDECGVCNGDGFSAKCTDIEYIAAYYDSSGSCLSMDCLGVCTEIGGGVGTGYFDNFYYDKDGDGWGHKYAGYVCSATIDSVSSKFYDNDGDLIACESNDADVCGICAGNNKDLSVCSKSEFTNKNECEQSGSTWTASFQGPNIDCSGTCFEASAPDSLKAELDECSNECCGGSTGVKCSYFIDQYNFDGNYDCLGVCNGTNLLDDCGECNGDNLIDSDGYCLYPVYPGDTDMNGKVNVEDLAAIINYFGLKVESRESKDITGKTLALKSEWKAQGQRKNRYDCNLYADANGDGLINISDVTTVFKNISKTHSDRSLTDCSAIARESDRDIYFSIFKGLPNGDIKQSMADFYGFEMPPESFKVFVNYPNPFNPVTTIEYEIPENGKVVINIFNVKGESLLEKKETKNSPGLYSFTWDASGFSSGIYYYTIQFNDIKLGKQKMVYIK